MAEKRYSLGVVGERDVVLAFRALGMRVLCSETPDQTRIAVHTLVTEGVPIIFMTENAAQGAPETLKRYASDPAVSIIPIPGSRGTNGFGMRRVRDNVEKAIGADILLNEEE